MDDKQIPGPVGQVFKLSDGYMLVLYGRTIACRTEKELGQELTKRIKKPPKGYAAAPTPPPKAPTPPVSLTKAPDAPSSLARDDELLNLDRLMNARFNG